MFSVLISVYGKENSQYLEDSLSSILNQTLVPSEIVLIKDGPLTADLDFVIDKFSFENPKLFKIIPLEFNHGLGKALKIGINACSNEIIARMDSDDICFSNRFERQIHYMLNNSRISVLGASVCEFNIKPNDLNSKRILPLEFSSISKFSIYRNPLNHPSVVFKKSAILEVNSYIDMPFFEDYFLWVRLIKNGFVIENLEDPVLYFRIGNDMVGRRHGLSYLKHELRFLLSIKSIGHITTLQFLISIILKAPLRLLPKGLLIIVYKHILR